MQTVIFSDTHLTHHFDSQLYDYIKKIIESADQVVINGDFWDAYLTTFDAFVQSEWQKLFALLQKKHTVYVFGNHDKREFMDERMSWFSQEQLQKYSFESAGKHITVEHGHLLAPADDARWLLQNPTFTRLPYRLFTALEKYAPLFDRMVEFLYKSGLDARQLEALRKYVEKLQSGKKHFVFGHTHLLYQNDALGMTSCGLTKNAQYSYCIVDTQAVRTALL